MYTLVHTHCYVHSLYTIYLSHIQHIHIQYTCIVTEMDSCAQHIHTLMYSTLTHTHMYIARKVYSKLVLCTFTCNINSFNCFMHVFDFYTLSLCSLRVELPCGWFSVHRHSHHRSRRCEEIKLSYWAQPLLIFFLFAMLSFVPLA